MSLVGNIGYAGDSGGSIQLADIWILSRDESKKATVI